MWAEDTKGNVSTTSCEHPEGRGETPGPGGGGDRTAGESKARQVGTRAPQRTGIPVSSEGEERHQVAEERQEAIRTGAHLGAVVCRWD